MARFSVYVVNAFGLTLFPGSTTSVEPNQIFFWETFSYLPIITQKGNSNFSNFKLHMMDEISISMEIMIYLTNGTIKLDTRLGWYSSNKKVFSVDIKSLVSRKFGNIKSNLVCHSFRRWGGVLLDTIVSKRYDILQNIAEKILWRINLIFLPSFIEEIKIS